MNGRAIGTILVVLCVLVPLGVAAQNGGNGFELAAENSIDTPDKTVTVDGDQYEVDSIARVASGESMTVTASAPDDATYDLYLYNNDRQIVATKGGSGNTSWTLDSSSYAPGSYVVAIYGSNGRFKAVQSLVFAGHDVRVNATNSTQGEPSRLTVTPSAIAETEPVSSVEVVFAGTDSETVKRLDATQSADSTYSVQPRPRVPTGDYRVYAIVRGEAGYENRSQILGISEPQLIHVDGSGANATAADPTASESTPAGSSTTDSVVTPNDAGTATSTSGTIPDRSPQLLFLVVLVCAFVSKLRFR